MPLVAVLDRHAEFFRGEDGQRLWLQLAPGPLPHEPRKFCRVPDVRLGMRNLQHVEVVVDSVPTQYPSRDEASNLFEDLANEQAKRTGE